MAPEKREEGGRVRGRGGGGKNETVAHTTHSQHMHTHTKENIPLRRADQYEAVCPSVLCRDMAFLPLGVGKKKTNTTFDHQAPVLTLELLEKRRRF